MTSEETSGLRVGADIGGTFTDLVFKLAEGRLDRRKVPSTPDDYSRAVVEGIAAFCNEEGIDPASISEVVHATTVATNAILERKGARTALLTTDGFRDVLELRRIRIPMLYDLGWEKPVPLAERALRFTVPERVDARGKILLALDVESLEPVIAAIEAADVEAVAVCFLHSYREPRHERQVGEILRARLPGVHISLSSEVLPEILEFERTSTTVVNAYVAPLIGRYLAKLRSQLEVIQVRSPVMVMQSNGGLISAHTATHRPVTIIESGPAAGVVAAAFVARQSGEPNVITLDMGGTTTKASIIEGGEVLRASEYEIGSPVSISSRLVSGSGYPLRIPVIDISEVGAGGGSLTELDDGGALRVGPHSAGAVPGPVCYGNGNEQPTVTDANLVLGYLDPNSLAGGALPVDRQLAIAAIETKIAGPCRLSVPDSAYGIHQIANSNMVRAIKSVSVERGRDPSSFVMMAFGGAGPVHAAGVARELGIRRVLIPPASGVFSAYGLIGAEIEHHEARTVLTSTADPDMAAIQTILDDIHSVLVSKALDEGYSADAVKVSYFVDLRYRGQSSEITVPFPEARISFENLQAAEARFEDEFEKTYGHRGDSGEFELVTVRLVGTVRRNVAHGGEWIDGRATALAGQDSRDVYFGKQFGFQLTPILSRTGLGKKAQQGPVIIQEYDTTVVVPPNCTVALDPQANIVIDIN